MAQRYRFSGIPDNRWNAHWPSTRGVAKLSIHRERERERQSRPVYGSYELVHKAAHILSERIDIARRSCRCRNADSNIAKLGFFDKISANGNYVRE